MGVRYSTSITFAKLDIQTLKFEIDIMAEKNTEAGLPSFHHLEMSSTDLRRDSTSDNLGALKTDIREIANIEVTDEQNRRVLRKIDRW